MKNVSTAGKIFIAISLAIICAIAVYTYGNFVAKDICVITLRG